MSATDAPLRRCGLYGPGHMVHLIQAIRSLADNEHPPEDGLLLRVESDGLVVIEVDGEERRIWNHDPRRLEHIVMANGGRTLHQPRWGMLRTPNPSDGSIACFCVARADDPELVPFCEEPPSGDLLGRLATAGGFLITFDEAERWIGARRLTFDQAFSKVLGNIEEETSDT
jgi:hypothetical protein